MQLPEKITETGTMVTVVGLTMLTTDFATVGTEAVLGLEEHLSLIHI